jgi:hypothetical protein
MPRLASPTGGTFSWFGHPDDLPETKQRSPGTPLHKKPWVFSPDAPREVSLEVGEASIAFDIADHGAETALSTQDLSRYSFANDVISGVTAAGAARPEWLPRVQMRLLQSAERGDDRLQADVSTLPEVLAVAGVRFFRDYADVLPGEPYLYKSSRGDLMAEYVGPHGRMTNVINTEHCVVLAAWDGEVVQHSYRLAGDESALRAKLKTLRKKISQTTHGAVDTRPR